MENDTQPIKYIHINVTKTNATFSNLTMIVVKMLLVKFICKNPCSTLPFIWIFSQAYDTNRHCWVLMVCVYKFSTEIPGNEFDCVHGKE